MSKGKIITFYSFRGGVGQSVVAGNVAIAIASKGHKVGIVDLDFLTPGISCLFQPLLRSSQNLSYTLNDYIWGRGSVKIFSYPLNFSQQTRNQEANTLFLIPASFKFGDIARSYNEEIDLKLLCDGLYQLIEELRLDYLIIDPHPGINPVTRLALSIAETMVIVLRPTEQDFQENTFTLEMAQKIGIKKKMMILNQFPKDMLLRINPDDLSTAVHKAVQRQASLIGVLPESESMRSEQIPKLLGKLQTFGQSQEDNPKGIFYLDYPLDPWSQAIAKIGDKLLG